MDPFIEVERRVRRSIFGPIRSSEQDLNLREKLHRLGETVKDLDLRVTEIENSRDPWGEISRALRGDENEHDKYSAGRRRD